MFFFLPNVSYGYSVVFIGCTYSFIFIYSSNLDRLFLFSYFFSICRSIYFLSLDPFVGFARCREGIARNKSGSNVPVARFTGTPNTEPRLQGVDKSYMGERVATSTQNVRERNIGG